MCKILLISVTSKKYFTTVHFTSRGRHILHTAPLTVYIPCVLPFLKWKWRNNTKPQEMPRSVSPPRLPLTHSSEFCFEMLMLRICWFPTASVWLNHWTTGPWFLYRLCLVGIDPESEPWPSSSVTKCRKITRRRRLLLSDSDSAASAQILSFKLICSLKTRRSADDQRFGPVVHPG